MEVYITSPCKSWYELCELVSSDSRTERLYVLNASIYLAYLYHLYIPYSTAIDICRFYKEINTTLEQQPHKNKHKNSSCGVCQGNMLCYNFVKSIGGFLRLS